MHCRFRGASFALIPVAVLLGTVTGLHAQRHRNKNDEPKNQTLPLPRELPMVLAAETARLDFHVSPLLKTGGLSAQIRRSVAEIIRDTHGETIVKLRAFVSGAGDARRVQAEVTGMFSERRLPLPVLTVVQVGGFGEDLSQVIIEAVVSTGRRINPNGLAFLAGQTASSLTGAVERLRDNAAEAGVPMASMVETTCYAARLENGAEARAAVRAIFPQAAVNVVQALRDPPNNAVTCEAIGQLRRPPAQGALVLMKEARIALVNTPRLLFTGLQLTFGSYLDDAREAFSRLQRAAATVETADSPVQVNAFSLDATASAALRKTTSVAPSTFTVHTVEGLPSVDASSGIEAVLASETAGPPMTAH